MVTTFNPPPRKKVVKKTTKSKPPTTLIVLGVICVVLLVAVFALLNKSGQAQSRATMLSDSFLEVAQAAGMTDITQDTLANSETAVETLEAVRARVAENTAALETATAGLTQARTNAERVQTELTAANTAVSEAEAASLAATRRLTEAESRLSSIDAERKQEVEDLNAEIETLKAEIASLNGEISSLAEPMAEVVEEAEDVMEGVEDLEEAMPPSMEVVKGKPESSTYFSSYQYDAGQSNLTLRASVGKSIKFMDVPQEAYESMTNAPVFDMFFRFKLMDVYESKPDAREFMINL